MWMAVAILGLLAFLVLLVLGIIFIFKKNGKAMQAFVGSLLCLLLFIVGAINSPAEATEPAKEALANATAAPTSAPKSAPTAVPTPVKTEAPVPLTPLDIARNAVHKAFGETNSFDKTDSIKEITLDQGKTLTIKVVGKDNLTNNMILFSMHSGIADTLKSLDGNKDIGTVAFKILFPMQDKFGKESLPAVMITEFSPETRGKIVWDNFISDDIPAIADAYWHNKVFD